MTYSVTTKRSATTKYSVTTKRSATTKHSLAFAILLLSILIVLSSCSSRSRQGRIDADGTMHGTVSLSGAFALYPLAVQWAQEFQRLHPDVRVEVDAGGAGKGMTDALTGQVEFGMLSREVSDAERKNGAVAYTVAMDAVVPTVSADNPLLKDVLAHGISAKDAKEIWGTGKIRTWGDLLGKPTETVPIAVFTRSDACGAAATWAAWMDLHQEDLLGEGVNGDPGMAIAVAKNKYAIGMNNIGYAYDDKTKKPLKGITVLPVDINGDGRITSDEQFYDTADHLAAAIEAGIYPAPPARYLYLVSKGEPKDPVVRAFLEYVLTDGQALNAKAGYIKAPK